METDIQNATPFLFEFEALREAHHYRQAILREFEPFLKGDLLEVGAGIGQFTELLARVKTLQTIMAVEPQPDFCAKLSHACAAAEVVQGTIEQVPPLRKFDGLVSVNVLEHIEDDVRELRRYRARLKDSTGCLCLFVPAGPNLYSPIDKQFGHFRRYSPEMLKYNLVQSGFEPIRIGYFNFVGYFLWWWEFKTMKRQRFYPTTVALFDRYIFPLARFMETRLFRPFVGQSLLAIARAR